MKPNMKIAVVDERKKGRTLLADALFRAAIKIMAARGDPVRAAEEVAEIFRRAETDLKDSPGLESFLVLTGSTRLENVGDYVYQPTCILQSVADLIQEVKTGNAAERLKSPAFVERNGVLAKFGQRHQTDTMMFHKPRPRPAMTK